MADEYTEFLGSYEGNRYFLTVRAKPNFDQLLEFGVVVHYADAEIDSNREAARIDTAHGYVHFDKLYRRDQPKEPLDIGLWKAVVRLKDNWRRYAESYDRNNF